MNESFKKFDEQFNEEKKKEIYNNIRINQPFFARLDGWAFHTFTKKMKFVKPFDKALTQRLVDASSKIFDVFRPTFAYCFSDEISFFFLEPPMFNRLEKIDSLLPSFFASVFSVTNSTACFDCRVIPITDSVNVVNYLIWRQAECRRNFLNGWAEQILKKYDKLSATRTAKALKGLDGKELKELCLSKGVDLDTVPKWQQNGTILHISTYFKNGFNPITRENVLAKRQYVKEDWEIPRFESKEGKEYITYLLSLYNSNARGDK
jgi:tRNA(His) 5'-end guanylyltransferase